MKTCIICLSQFLTTDPATSCDCGAEITREMARALTTKDLTTKRRRWLLFPELVKRENQRRKFFAAEVAKASQSQETR